MKGAVRPRLSDDKAELDLAYTITEGKQYRLVRVDIHGAAQHTHFHSFVDRLSLNPGDIIDCNKLRDDERRLKFNSVFPSKNSIPTLIIEKSSEHSSREQFEQTTFDLHLWRNAADNIEAVFSWPSDPPRIEIRAAGQIAQ